MRQSKQGEELPQPYRCSRCMIEGMQTHLGREHFALHGAQREGFEAGDSRAATALTGRGAVETHLGRKHLALRGGPA